MTESSVLRRALAAATALCLVAGVGVALARGGDGDRPAGWVGTVGEQAGRTTTTAGGAPETAPAGVPETAPAGGPGARARPSTTTAGGAASSAAAPSAAAPSGPAAPAGPAPAADLGTPADPGNVIPPAPGTYRYRTTTNGETRETTTVVEDVSRSPSETKQIITLDVGPVRARNDVVWQADKVVVPKSAFIVGQTTADCDWTPDLVQAVLPMKEGVRWTNDTTCVTSFGTVRRRTDSTVKGLERLLVGGETVDVWRIEGTERSDVGGRTSDSTGTTWFSPRHGLIVKSQGRATSPEGTFEISSELLSLKPS